MNLEEASRVDVPWAFAEKLLEVLAPGATLYVTDSPVLPKTTGPSLNVVNSDPPASKP